MKFVPHQIAFDLAKTWRSFNDVLLVASTIVVIWTTFLEKQAGDVALIDGLNAINSILITFYIVCETASDYFLFKAEARRRLDFIDNSFNTNLSGKHSEEYFTNSSLDPGVYKLAVNCFENALFSNNVGKKMLPMLAFKNIFVIAVFILAAAMGEKKIVILIFQLSLPFILFQQLFKHWVYTINTETILDEFKSLFEDLKNTGPEKKMAKILQNIVHYESNISWGGVLLSSRVFNKMNAALSAEWQELKGEYKIQA